jgi:hypothetical protein
METIDFDTTSGISLEEQQEILAGINAMAIGSRLVPEAAVIEAKKKDHIFPLAVNIGALFLLGLGFLLLILFLNSGEQQIRESTAVLGLTERLLIQEIRQETNRLISEKENEISNILLLLSAVDAEYRVLSESLETLTAAQRERAAYLLSMQEEYQRSLAVLQDERIRILEDARIMEANLRTQAEESARELTLRIEQGNASLSEAMEELRRLGNEQERANRAENQMGGFYVTVNSQISDGRLTEASATLTTMREFLDAPSLQGIRVFETRKQTHLEAIAFMENAIAAHLDGLAALAQVPILIDQNDALDRVVRGLRDENMILDRNIAGYVDAIRELEEVNDNLQEIHRNEMSRLEGNWQNERDGYRREVTRLGEQVANLTTLLAFIREAAGEAMLVTPEDAAPEE